MEGLVEVFGNFYDGKNVFVTGHTGFKGGWLSLWLKRLGAHVTGYSLAPVAGPNLFEVVGEFACDRSVLGDIRDPTALAAAVSACNPDVVFHLAAQPIVRRSYAEPMETLATNVTGTANVLEEVRRAGKRTSVVVVTSDKCYANQEWEFAYRENDPLGGKDVYSMSKAAAELVAHAWNHSFFMKEPWTVRLATGRAGNVIGGGDYAEDRLIPDAVRSIAADSPIRVRNPESTRPWQHVFESVSGYLCLAAALYDAERPLPSLEAVNFGPAAGSNHTVRAAVDEAVKTWPGEIVLAPDPAAPREAGKLNVAVDRAAQVLDWRPAWDFSTAVRETMLWYKARHAGGTEDMLQLSIAQLDKYAIDARSAGLAWAR